MKYKDDIHISKREGHREKEKVNGLSFIHF